LHQVLILGAGLVSRPIVRYYLDRPDYHVTVASLYHDDAWNLVGEHPRATAMELDVSDDRRLEPVIADTDLVVSLVPYAFHTHVAAFALRHRVNMVTASYVLPEMRALDAEARDAGIAIVNEVGLDPGLDHMSAMRIIDRVHRSGGRVTGFRSCTGGLPSPEAADNPWRYKFSWSPRGALLAGRLGARFMEDGRVRHVPGPDLFAYGRDYDVGGAGRFEMYPNRDSLRYVDLYDIHDVSDMLRGTIRYPGWCETMKAVADLGLLEVDARSWPAGTTFADLVTYTLEPGPGSAAERLARHFDWPAGHPVLERFDWAGLLSDDPRRHHVEQHRRARRGDRALPGRCAAHRELQHVPEHRDADGRRRRHLHGAGNPDDHRYQYRQQHGGLRRRRPRHSRQLAVVRGRCHLEQHRDLERRRAAR